MIAPGGGTRPPFVLDGGLRAALLIIGTFALGVVVGAGAIAQYGVTDCTVCTHEGNGESCTGTGNPYCASTYLGLAVILGALTIACATIALGVSPNVLTRSDRGRPATAGEPRPGRGRLLVDFAAPFLAFLGWSLIAWGILLPFNEFGNCIEPCVYPYVLDGIPFTLVLFGAVFFGLGVALLVWVTRRQRVERRAAPEPGTRATQPTD